MANNDTLENNYCRAYEATQEIRCSDAQNQGPVTDWEEELGRGFTVADAVSALVSACNAHCRSVGGLLWSTRNLQMREIQLPCPPPPPFTMMALDAHSLQGPLYVNGQPDANNYNHRWSVIQYLDDHFLIRSLHGGLLDANNGTGLPYVVHPAPSRTDWDLTNMNQAWVFQNVRPGYYFILSRQTGGCLSARPGGAVSLNSAPDMNNPQHTWYLPTRPGGDQSYRFLQVRIPTNAPRLPSDILESGDEISEEAFYEALRSEKDLGERMRKEILRLVDLPAERPSKATGQQTMRNRLLSQKSHNKKLFSLIQRIIGNPNRHSPDLEITCDCAEDFQASSQHVQELREIFRQRPS